MSLFTPEPGLIIWMLFSFLIVVILLGKFAWPAILNAVERRALFIDKGVEDAKEATKKLEAVERKQKEMLDQAHAEQIRILNETQQLKSKLLEEARQEAAHEKQLIMDQTNQAIAQARLNAMKEIRKEVVDLSMRVSEKILRQNLENNNAREELIQKMLDEIMIKN
ncbi:MAG: F0F1 ATP synthase subunit B [Bacteroidales bacterium]